ncbi:MAG: tetratricopeptide repeat protein [Gemmatimonadetes bacterium]|nr:tetratricopeptide repeat protein [Gemmatimonadota bacterium]
MKTTRIGLTAIAGFTLALTLTTATPILAQTGPDLFQQALVKEQAEGDLRGAIALYQRIVKEFAGDRSLAARALVQMGRCHERLGSQDAQNAYRKVLADYADQTEEVEQARARLAAIQRSAARAADKGPPSAIRVREVWSGRYSQPVDDSGGPTPDGRHLVYVDWETGNLAVRDLATGASRLITEGGYQPGYALSAKVSPDGETVAFAWADSVGMKLRTTGMDGSKPQVLYRADEVYPLSWSADGGYLAAGTIDEDPRESRIVRIGVDDGSVATLYAYPYGVLDASFAPGGRFLAVAHPVDKDSGRFDIELLSLAGGDTLPLVHHPADDRLVGWVPGTDAVLFTSDRSGNRDLFTLRVNEDGSAGDPVPLRRGVGELGPMGFAEDGSLFYSNYTLQYTNSIASFDERTGRIDVAGAEPLLGSFDNCRAAWSPDGHQLLLVTREHEPGFPKGRGFAFRLRNLASGTERVLTRDLNPGTIGGPRWLPDGRSVLLVAQERAGGDGRGWSDHTALYKIDTHSGEFESLFDFEANWRWWFDIGFVPTVSGEGVYYVHDGRLVLHRLADNQETELYRNPQLAPGILALSPDGSDLLFGVNDADHSQMPRLREGGKLMIMPAGGGEVRVLAQVQDSTPIVNAYFTSDGEHVLYHRGDQDGLVVMRVSRDGGQPQRLFESGRRMNVTPSPDRKRAALMVQTNEAEIWVMENLKEALNGIR